MADSQIWLQNLALSLKASRQVAYLYHVEDDKYEFLGDVMGVFGIADEDVPTKLDQFKKMIADDDIVTRQLSLAEALKDSKHGEKSFSIGYKLQRNNGASVPVIETGIVRFNTETGKTTIHSLMALDTEKIEHQKRLSKKMGFRTTVSNMFSGNSERQELLDRLQEMKDTEHGPTGFLLVVGLERLSLVNEIYGNSFADDLLKEVNQILETVVAEQAGIYQTSGDTFTLLFDKKDAGEMNDIAQNILKIFYSQSIEVHERQVHQIVSIGGVRLMKENISPTSLLGRAELALTEARNRGRGCFVEYTEQLSQAVKSFGDMLSIGDGFLKGFKDNRVKIAFQGIVNSRTKDISFHECLIRLIDEDGEVHTAGKFIDAIEKMGLTRLVDTFATREAIRELKEYPVISLSVNVSNHTFTDPEWLGLVKMELRDRPDVAERLIVEITESVAMNDINQTLRVARTLQDLGCRIALDDFGAGQTAFSQLKDLSLDIVKIDKSFVRDMDKEENKLFIKTLHALASAMNLETVGEGAETLAEADVLARDGVDHIQGFVYGLPTMEKVWAEQKEKDDRKSH